jgi:hypothetical protein
MAGVMEVTMVDDTGGSLADCQGGQRKETRRAMHT